MNEVQDSAKEQSPARGAFARFFRWRFCGRVMRRGLFMLACLATLTGLFYAVENWRGKRAWEKCQRELEAKGEVLDWNAYIPAPVPDDQNIFKAPRMAEWFVKGSFVEAISGESSKSRNTAAPFSLAPRQDAEMDSVLVAEVDVVPPEAPLPSGKADAVLGYEDPSAREQAAKLLEGVTGPRADGAQGCAIVARPRDQMKPRHLILQILQADTLPTVTALTEFFTHSPTPEKAGATPGLGYLQVERVGSNGFQVSLKSSVYTAADYLAASEPAVPDLNLLRKALERPCARMDSDYQRPFERPIPNFVRLRTVAQMLSQRAQCCLLLGQPEAAWHELALVRDLCRTLEGKPASNCPMLVEAMIDVAISGLYVSIVQDGLRLRAWREPELAAMQKQLTDINLLPLVRASFNAEQAASCRTFEITPPAEYWKLFFSPMRKPGLWEKLENPTFLFLRFAPRGWMYQNMCEGALLEQRILGTLDIPNNQVLPGKLENVATEIGAAGRHRSPYNFLAVMALPNYVRASQTMARNQTLANEALIACGLERYRLAHGQYPETLESLVPQFAAKLPHDIVVGQPLKYHRTANGNFVLYSVGWNENDDGGVPGKTIGEGDWVWQ